MHEVIEILKLNVWLLGCLMGAGGAACAQAAAPHTAVELLRAVIANEDTAGAHRECYEYLAVERSERTGGHVWTERVVETAEVRVNRLLAVDGRALATVQERQERERLLGIAAHPEAFVRKALAERNDELHARHMLDLLPTDFLFDSVKLENGAWRLEFRPNPAVSPSGMEDQVLHGMNGWLAIDAQQMRLMHIEGQLAEPVLVGFGMVANIHAGSHFMSDRREVEGHWRTVHVLTDVEGKAALFKSVAKNSEIRRSDFHYFGRNLTVTEAVAQVLGPSAGPM